MNISPFCQNAPKSRGTMFDGVARGMLPAPLHAHLLCGGGESASYAADAACLRRSRICSTELYFSLLDKKPCICNN